MVRTEPHPQLLMIEALDEQRDVLPVVAPWIAGQIVASGIVWIAFDGLTRCTIFYISAAPT
jgi:hypothetical protein